MEIYIYSFLAAWFAIIGTHAVMRVKLDSILDYRQELIIVRREPEIIARNFRIPHYTFARPNNFPEMLQSYIRQSLIYLTEEAMKKGLVKVRCMEHYPTNSEQYEVSMAFVKMEEDNDI